MRTPQLCFPLVLLLLFAVLPTAALAQGNSNPCDQVLQAYKRQISDLKRDQSKQLKQCRERNGRNSPACTALEADQEQAMQEIRGFGQIQLYLCSPVSSSFENAESSNDFHINYYDFNQPEPAYCDPDHDGDNDCSRYGDTDGDGQNGKSGQDRDSHKHGMAGAHGNDHSPVSSAGGDHHNHSGGYSGGSGSSTHNAGNSGGSGNHSGGGSSSGYSGGGHNGGSYSGSGGGSYSGSSGGSSSGYSGGGGHSSGSSSGYSGGSYSGYSGGGSSVSTGSASTGASVGGHVK